MSSVTAAQELAALVLVTLCSPSSAQGRRRAGTSRCGVDAALAARVGSLIAQHPTFGCRRLWATPRYRDGLVINRGAVYCAFLHLGWFVHQRQVTLRPRVQGWRSQTTVSNRRWAMDVTHIPVGIDGWAHLAAVIDCHDRETIGYEFAFRALEEACLSRFRTVRPTSSTPVVESDNGLIFQSRRFRRACHDYRRPRLTRLNVVDRNPAARCSQ